MTMVVVDDISLQADS